MIRQVDVLSAIQWAGWGQTRLQFRRPSGIGWGGKGGLRWGSLCSLSPPKQHRSGYGMIALRTESVSSRTGDPTALDRTVGSGPSNHANPASDTTAMRPALLDRPARPAGGVTRLSFIRQSQPRTKSAKKHKTKSKILYPEQVSCLRKYIFGHRCD